MPLILLLLMVWVLALAPYIWKKVSQFRIDSEIGKFGSSISLITNHSPDIAHHNFSVYPDSPDSYQANSHKVHPESNLFYLPGYENMQHYTADSSQAHGTALHRRVDRQSLRPKTAHKRNKKAALRKRNLKILAASVLFTFTFGAIPVFNFLWYFCIVFFIATLAYVGLLYYMNNTFGVSQEKANYRSVGRERVPSRHTNASQVLAVQEIKRRPSFIIVDDPDIRQRALP